MLFKDTFPTTKKTLCIFNYKDWLVSAV